MAPFFVDQNETVCFAPTVSLYRMSKDHPNPWVIGVKVSKDIRHYADSIKSISPHQIPGFHRIGILLMVGVIIRIRKSNIKTILN